MRLLRLPLLLVGALLASVWPAVAGDGAAPAGDWLVSRRGLVYGYAFGVTSVSQPRVIAFDEKGERTEAGKNASFVANRDGGLVARGVARLDHNFALLTEGGSFLATGGVTHLTAACKSSGAFTVEALLTPVRVPLQGRGTILWVGPSSGSPNLALCQEGAKITLRLRTAVAGNATESTTELCTWPDAGTHHLAVTFAGAVLTAYLDGQPVRPGVPVAGDLSRWRAAELVFGDDFQATANWPGKLEAIAVYDRALDAAEVRQQNDVCRARMAGRKEPACLRLTGKLTARSETPDVARIEPYRRALGVYEYAVEAVKEGTYKEPVVRVAHWVIMDKQKLPIGQRRIGETAELTLEPYAANPQIETEFWVLDDAAKEEIPLMLDVGSPAR